MPAELPKPPALLRPSDLCRVDGLRAVHQGYIGTIPAISAA